jgi:hypothetical protein
MTDIKIRKASIDDLSEILAIYSGARDFMASVGNPTQWGTSHPNEELLRSDIEEGDLFAVVNDGKVIGVFITDLVMILPTRLFMTVSGKTSCLTVLFTE